MTKLNITTLPLSEKKLSVIRSDVTIAHDSFEPGLVRRALFKTGDIDVSQDLVQTTFLKTLRYLQRGGKIDLMKSFLSHILNDLIVDEYRKRTPLSLDMLLEKGFDAGFDDSERLMNIFDGKEIIALIPLLPKKYQTVVQMRYIQSLSLKEMALLTGQSPNTVAVQVHRGLTQLKVLYQESHAS